MAACACNGPRWLLRVPGETIFMTTEGGFRAVWCYNSCYNSIRRVLKPASAAIEIAGNHWPLLWSKHQRDLKLANCRHCSLFWKTPHLSYSVLLPCFFFLSWSLHAHFFIQQLWGNFWCAVHQTWFSPNIIKYNIWRRVETRPWEKQTVAVNEPTNWAAVCMNPWSYKLWMASVWTEWQL